jgi:hypothetical protein
MKAYLIIYVEDEEIDDVCGFKQLQEFTQYRIENYEYEEELNYKDFNNLTEQECLDILEQDGYEVQQYEIY